MTYPDSLVNEREGADEDIRPCRLNLVAELAEITVVVATHEAGSWTLPRVRLIQVDTLMTKAARQQFEIGPVCDLSSANLWIADINGG